MSEIEDVLSVPLQLPNPKKGDKILMNEFIFDLQRFADYTITAGGESVSVSGGSGDREETKTIAVTIGTETINYSLLINGTANISANEVGTVKIQVTSGYIREFVGEDRTYANYILTGGTAHNNNGGFLTLGEGGPTFDSIWSGAGDRPVSITLTPYTNYNDVLISCSFVGRSILGFSRGRLSYAPAAATSTTPATISARIQDGKTFINVDENNTATIKYRNKTFTPSNGTFILAMANDGSDSYVTGLENGDSFKLGDVTYNMGKVRFSANDGTTTKFWNQGIIENTTEILLSKVDVNSENFSPAADFLIDGTDYYTLLNPGLVPLLTDGTSATQYTGANGTTTGVAIGVGNTPITIGVPTKLSTSNVAQILLDIAPKSSASQVLNVYFPYAASSFFFKVTLTSGGSLTVDAYNGSNRLDTTNAINLATYGVNLTKPIRLLLQTDFAESNNGKTFVSVAVGSYVYNKELSTSVIFNGTNCSFKFASDSTDEIKISNIIIRDEQIGQIAEKIISLPARATVTDMAESNGIYTAAAVGEIILKTPNVADLVQTHDGASVVTAVLVVGNPAYKTSNGLNKLISIDKTGGVVTEHNSFKLTTNSAKAIADNWRPENATLNGLANMQFGWKAGA